MTPRRRFGRWLWSKRWTERFLTYGWWTRALMCFPCSPGRDMCGQPDHDYCEICGRSMPGAARLDGDAT